MGTKLPFTAAQRKGAEPLIADFAVSLDLKKTVDGNVKNFTESLGTYMRDTLRMTPEMCLSPYTRGGKPKDDASSEDFARWKWFTGLIEAAYLKMHGDQVFDGVKLSDLVPRIDKTASRERKVTFSPDQLKAYRNFCSTANSKMSKLGFWLKNAANVQERIDQGLPTNVKEGPIEKVDRLLEKAVKQFHKDNTGKLLAAFAEDDDRLVILSTLGDLRKTLHGWVELEQKRAIEDAASK